MKSLYKLKSKETLYIFKLILVFRDIDVTRKVKKTQA